MSTFLVCASDKNCHHNLRRKIAAITVRHLLNRSECSERRNAAPIKPIISVGNSISYS